MIRKRKCSARVTIDVVDWEPDILRRVALLNGTFIRVVTGTKLIGVRAVDYERGHLEALVEAPRSVPRVSGRVSVHYEPA